MPKYLLPCECGKGIAVEVSQAGQQIACECGNQLEVPTLRGIRALEPLQESEAIARPPREWDLSRGMVFAGSLVLIVIGAAVAFYGYAALRVTPNITREIEAESFDMAVDDMSLDETYEIWKNFREHGLRPRGQNPYVNLRSFRAGRQRMLVVGIALCVLGSLGAIGATFMPRKISAGE